MGRRTITLIAAFVIAAIGASLIFLYVQGVDNAAQAEAEPVQVLTATSTIAAGEKVSDAAEAGKFALSDVPRSAVIPGALTQTDTITDQVALAEVVAGEQIIPTKFAEVGSQSRITIPPKMLAVSVELTNPQRVAGFVSPGSDVAIFSVPAPGGVSVGSNAALVRLLLAKVQVIGVGQSGMSNTTTTDGTGEQTVEQIPTTILTLALDQRDAERLMLADSQGELTFGLLTDGSRVSPSLGTTVDNLFSGQ